MKAHEQTLRSFLGGQAQFVAPGFQRPYGWGLDAWQAIFNSLQGARRGEHFLGAMVVMPLAILRGEFEKYLLVDGQQRLMTVLLLLAALRDALEPHSHARAQGLARAGLFNESQEGPYRYKLLPTKSDRNAFESIMNGKPVPRGGRRLVEAHRFFLEGFADGSFSELDAAARAMMRHFMVVRILLEKNEDPYPIFKSLSAPEQPFTGTGLEAYYQFSSDPELMALIAAGESHEVEFKESAFQRPPRDGDESRGSAHVVRSVAGFMNSASGGTLLLGVRDNGSIRGVNDDYPLADRGKPGWDGFQLYLGNLLRTRLSIENAFLFFRIERRLVEGRDVAMISVTPAPAPVYVDKHLYVRGGAQTLEMQGPDLVRYVNTRWRNPGE